MSSNSSNSSSSSSNPTQLGSLLFQDWFLIELTKYFGNKEYANFSRISKQLNDLHWLKIRDSLLTKPSIWSRIVEHRMMHLVLKIYTTKQHQNINYSDTDKKWVVQQACMEGKPHLELFRYLLKDDRISVNYNYCVAFRAACLRGYEEIVKLFLEDGRVDPGLFESEALRKSMKGGSQKLGIIKMLIDHPKIQVGAMNQEAIRFACAYGETEVVRLLLQHPSVNPSTQQNACIRSAAELPDVELMKLLLAHPSVNPGAINNEALRIACQKGNVEVVKLLIADGRVLPSDNNNEAIVKASAAGHANIVAELLTKRSVHADAQDNEPLKVSAASGYIEVLKVLLKHAVDPNVGVKKAIVNEHKECLSLLLEDSRIDKSKIVSYIDLASYYHSRDIQKMLKDKRNVWF